MYLGKKKGKQRQRKAKKGKGRQRRAKKGKERQEKARKVKERKAKRKEPARITVPFVMQENWGTPPWFCYTKFSSWCQCVWIKPFDLLPYFPILQAHQLQDNTLYFHSLSWKQQVKHEVLLTCLPNGSTVHAATKPRLVTEGGGPVSLAVTVLFVVADLQSKTDGLTWIWEQHWLTRPPNQWHIWKK